MFLPELPSSCNGSQELHKCSFCASDRLIFISGTATDNPHLQQEMDRQSQLRNLFQYL